MHCRLEREGKLEAAMKCYREALADDPHQVTARERLKVITVALEMQVEVQLCTVAVIPTAMLKFTIQPFCCVVIECCSFTAFLHNILVANLSHWLPGSWTLALTSNPVAGCDHEISSWVLCVHLFVCMCTCI